MAEPVQSRFGAIAPTLHTHPDVPKVFVQAAMPLVGMIRGDIWCKINASTPPVEPPVEPVPTDPYGDVIRADNPFGYWKLDETSGTIAIDNMNNYHGTVHGSSVVRGEMGVSNTTYRFTDTSGYVSIGNTGSLINTNGGAFSAECWFKINTQTATTEGQGAFQLFGTDCFVDQTLRDGWGIFMLRETADVGAHTGEVFGRVVYQSTALYANYGTRVDNNAWHHAVLVFDGANVILYVDGAMRETLGALGGNNQGSNPAVIGYNYELPHIFGLWEDNPHNIFPGSIDEVAFYRHALAPDRVLAHYQAK